jgi:Flp pilus assembly protein TadB
MALADNRPVRLMASTNRTEREVEPMSEPRQQQPTVSLVTATAWAAAVLAAIAVVGLIAAPSLTPIWIVLLLFAVVAVPQALLRTRRERRGHGQGRGSRRNS